MRGEVSEGMMLAADDGTSVKYITVPESISPGTQVVLGDYQYNGTGTIEVKTLQSIGLRVKQANGQFRVEGSLRDRQYFLKAGEEFAFVSGESKDGANVR